MSLFSELKRRNVFRVAATYIVLSWLLMQVADVLQNALELPAIWSKGLLALLVLGFLPALVFSWAYEITPEGLKKESEVPKEASIATHTARKLDLVVIGLLVVAIVLFVVDRFGGDDPARTVDSTPAPSPATGDEDGVPVIAVLPLKAMSTEEEGVFLANGLHDDLLTRLAKLQAFKVISRTSVMEYADTTKNMRDIGTELGAGYIVEGGLQAIGGRVSINAQLIDTATDEHLWAETYNRPLNTTNLFEVQADIAAAISTALSATLSPSDHAVLEEFPTDNLEAYRAYLRGLETRSALDRPSIMASLDAFSEAVELDPTFGQAWAHLAVAHLRRFWEEGGERDINPQPQWVESARLAVERAEALAPGAVETLRARAIYHYYGFRDYEAALDVIAAAESIAPFDHEVIALRGFILRRFGRVSEAADQLQRALEYAPTNRGHMRETISTLFDAGRCEDSLTLAENSINRYPGDSGIVLTVSASELICRRNVQRTLALVERVPVTVGHQFLVKAKVYLHAGHPAGGLRMALEEQGLFEDNPVMSLSVANHQALFGRLLGDADAESAALQRIADKVETLALDSSAALMEASLAAALLGQPQRSAELGQRALETFPRDSYVLSTITYRMLWTYALAGAESAFWSLLEEWVATPLYSDLALMDANPFLASFVENPRFIAARSRGLQRFSESGRAQSARAE